MMSLSAPWKRPSITKTSFARIITASALPLALAADLCAQWDRATSNNYIVYNNLWNKNAASAGNQYTRIDKTSGSTISWRTSYTWTGGALKGVKSYSNAALVFTPKQISSISSIPTTIQFTYLYNTALPFVTDVSYDLFTSSTPNGKHEFGIMIFLAAYAGAGPISRTGKSIATVTIGSNVFNLYKGPNGSTTVFSFVATRTLVHFSADLKDFLSYLVKNHGLPLTQYLTDVQAGTEPFSSERPCLQDIPEQKQGERELDFYDFFKRAFVSEYKAVDVGIRNRPLPVVIVEVTGVDGSVTWAQVSTVSDTVSTGQGRGLPV
ncbi:hypothetical protein PsorP6_013185 [Peronosclerospora sorghi]|uniref:Uncharacterized protein n=1 Tax=Peronosclerospora sorghi TaxID=230839 RepID=A0ACC0WGZ5_9STRA|nr:hypothetical protein PsorP6_013185 [Peronosclerospora sorghi]